MESKNKIARAYGMCGDKERCIQAFGGETRGKQTTWKT